MVVPTAAPTPDSVNVHPRPLLGTPGCGGLHPSQELQQESRASGDMEAGAAGAWGGWNSLYLLELSGCCGWNNFLRVGPTQSPSALSLSPACE